MDAWALISVSDKTGLESLARYLTRSGLKLLATSSTAQHLVELGFAVETVEHLTGFGEVLGGRVKTLHPLIYGGLLASDSQEHQDQRQKLGAPDIRLVVVDLYPFEKAWKNGVADCELIETIDIGGVSLIRAAAKNYGRVAVLVSPDQYPAFMETEWSEHTIEQRRGLAAEAFHHVAYYDAMIGQALGSLETEWPVAFALPGLRQQSLRYGENPHQAGSFYRYPRAHGFAQAEVLQGKALSYNNLADADTAVRLAYDFDQAVAVAVKHQTPCAVATAATVDEAYVKAHAADSVSIFGGIVAVNRPINEVLAQHLTQIFLEVVIAPDVSDAALKIFSTKKNLRVLKMDQTPLDSWDVRGIWGGFLIQPNDRLHVGLSGWRHVAGPMLGDGHQSDLELAWKTVARAKSNAIVVVKDGVTIGIASGETNRIDAARHALQRAGEGARGAVLASDGFFPFGDVLRLAQECGIAVVVEPGGSVRDEESVAVANAAGVTLLMTGERHFRH